MSPRVLADRYELDSKIGSGGMGTVWKAKDRLLDRTVAVKVLHEGLASDAAFGERFRREARSAASLGHPHVVAVYDTGEDDGIPFIVMEYVEGRSLHQILAQEGPLPVEDAARIGRAILSGLAHAHSRGLIHRDMKPANVLCDASSGEAKVVDFGIAKGLEDTGGLTRTSGLIGTAAYLSPEQVNGQPAVPASDLYAVGCLLYASLAGDPPFSGSTPVAIAMRHLRDPVPPLRARRPDVPPDFEAVIARALDKDPARRFASAAEMDAAIAATGLADRASSAPTVVESPEGTVTEYDAIRAHPVGGIGETEVVQRAGTPGSYWWLPAVTAFLVVAAAAAIIVLWLQSRPTQLEEAPIPSATPALTVAPTSEPTPSPSEEPTPTDTPTPTQTDCANLPGLDLGCPETAPPTPSPTTPPASPAASP
jgi:eukaryotic-like serine/threonine-protein kinase